MKNTFRRIIAATLAAGLIIGLVPFDVHAETTNTEAENLPVISDSVNGMDPKDKIRLYEDDFGYIEPEGSLYDLPARSSARDRRTIMENMDGLKVNRDTVPSYFITSSKSYAGNGKTPDIAAYAKADDQGATGLCWIYSTLKAIEINLGIHGFDRVNLSEKSVAYWFWSQIKDLADEKSEDHGLMDSYNRFRVIPTSQGVTTYNMYYKKGGWDAALDSYFTAWKGFAREAGNNAFINKYDTDTVESIPNVSDVYSGIDDRIRNIYHIAATDKDTIKRMIMKYGAATTAVKAENDAYSTGKAAWYTKNTGSNHQVIIIGWDDGYKKENFNGYYGQPENDGAWYCINSWDTGWEYWGWGNIAGYNDYKCDNNGGFWMSYETGYMQDEKHEVEFYEVSDKDQEEIWYDHNYAGGLAGNWDINHKSDYVVTFSDNSTAPFRKQGICYAVDNEGGYPENVEAIGFDTFEADTRWTLRTYHGNYDNKTLIDEQVIDLPLAGYHTIVLDKPFEVENGGAFYVELEPIGKGRLYNTRPGYTATNGSYVADTWCVITRFGSSFGDTYINGEKMTDCQAGIHAFTTDVIPDMTTSSKITTENLEATYGSDPEKLSDHYTFTAGTDRRGNPDSIKSITANNSNIKIDMKNDTVSFLKAGRSTVTIETEFGYTASFVVTVGKADISGAVISGIKESYHYESMGFVAEPRPVVTYHGVKLIEGEDYDVSYSDNNAAGYATVTIEGKGNFCGEAVVGFQILVFKKSRLSIIDSLKTGYAGEVVDISENYIFVPGLGNDGNATTVTIEAEDTDIVSINGTKASLLKEGYTTVNVSTSDGLSVEIGIQVLDFTVSSELTIYNTDITGVEGDTLCLDGYYQYIAGTDVRKNKTTLNIRVEDPSVIEVENGLIRLVSPGTTAILFETSDGNAGRISVTVNKKQEEVIEDIDEDDDDDDDDDQTDVVTDDPAGDITNDPADDITNDPVDDNIDDPADVIVDDPAVDGDTEPVIGETVSGDRVSPAHVVETIDNNADPEENSETVSPVASSEEEEVVYHLRRKEKKIVDIEVPKTILSVNAINETRSIRKTRFKSSDRKIAKVNSKGMVTAGKRSGTAMITKQVKVLTVLKTAYITKSGKEKVKKKKSRKWVDVGTVKVIVE